MNPALLIVATLHVLGSAGLTAISLGALAGAVNRRLDLLTHFTAIYLGFAVVGFLTALLLPRKARTWSLSLSLVTMLACAIPMVPEYLAGFRDHAGPDAPNQLKLVQFNAYGGEGADMEAAAHWIVAQNPDVIVLEEQGDIDLRIAKLAPYGINYGSPTATIMARSKAIENNAAEWNNPNAAPAHRRPPYPLVTWVTFNDSRGAYTILGVHRLWPTRLENTFSSDAELRQLLTAFPAHSAIVSGDFNTTPWSYDLRRLDSTLPVTRRTRGVFSWPAAVISHNRLPTPVPLLPIDHVYAGSDWKTVKVERGPNLGSDHYPVVVTLARVAGAGDR